MAGLRGEKLSGLGGWEAKQGTVPGKKGKGPDRGPQAVPPWSTQLA